MDPSNPLETVEVRVRWNEDGHLWNLNFSHSLGQDTQIDTKWNLDHSQSTPAYILVDSAINCVRKFTNKPLSIVIEREGINHHYRVEGK